MPTFNRLLGPDRANIWAMGMHAVGHLVAALAMTPYVVGACIAVVGACWITVMANNGTAVQMISPTSCGREAWRYTRWCFSAPCRGLAVLGKDRHAVRHAGLADPSAVALVPLTVLAASVRLPGSALPRG